MSAPPRTHRMRFPLSADDARRLRAGDEVVIDGEIVITAGVLTHQRLLGCLDGREPMPMDLRGAALPHLANFNRETPNGFEVLYVNPTTSTRFNPYMPRLITELELHAVGGKGGLDRHCAAAMGATGCAYLSLLGGGCALLSPAIRQVLQVGWSDMLTQYRLIRLKVEGLGPATVGIDAHGRSLYADAQNHAREQMPSILDALGDPRRERLEKVKS